MVQETGCQMHALDGQGINWRAVRDWSASAFWNVMVLPLICFGIPACLEQLCLSTTMNSLSHSGNQQAGNDTVRPKLFGPYWELGHSGEERVHSHIFIACPWNKKWHFFLFTAWETDSLCLSALFFLFFLLLTTFLSHGSFTCFRYPESSLEEPSSLKFPGVTLQLKTGLFSFTL